MKLTEIAQPKPLIWTILDKLVGGDGEVHIDCTGNRRNATDGSVGVRNKGFIYSTMPIATGRPNIPCAMEDAGALRINYTPSNEVGRRIEKMRSYYLELDADELYDIKKIDGIPTLVDADEA